MCWIFRLPRIVSRGLTVPPNEERSLREASDFTSTACAAAFDKEYAKCPDFSTVSNGPAETS